MKIKSMVYTKDSGDKSERDVIVVSAPRNNYLCYDVTNLSYEDREVLISALYEAETCRDNCIADFELVTGQRQSTLWRSFKPEGIDWVLDNDEV